MNKQVWIYAQLGVGGAIALLLVGVLVLFWQTPREFSSVDVAEREFVLPKNSFAQPREGYEAIRGDVLALSYATPTLQLPDLRQQVTYFGRNGRPDADGEHMLLHISLMGSQEIHSISPGEPFYLLFDKGLTPPRYVASPGNSPTSLWLLVEPAEGKAEVQVRMRNEKGEIIFHPAQLAQFSVAEREIARQPGKASWELGKWRVDGSLLARQRARWFGGDRFLERHGGEEFSEMAGKQRIDFGEGEEGYSVFVGLGDTLVWEDDRWKEVTAGPDSFGKPLLVIKKIDERLLTCELWDAPGKGKVLLNLIKSVEPWVYHHLAHEFKFVGAKTRSQYLFEIKGERTALSPHDWLLHTDEGWRKLTTIEEIDGYVAREMTGPLFIFDGVEKGDEQSVLVGTLYNKSRTDGQRVEIPMQQGACGAAEAPNGSKVRPVPVTPPQESDEQEVEEERQAVRRAPIPHQVERRSTRDE